MAFITKEDLKTNIRAYRLDQIIDDDDTIIEQASEEAEAIVTDHLHQYYDTRKIFNASGSDRLSNVLGWVKHIALYKIYERVPDELVPERVVKHYDETLTYLGKIAEGRVPVKLPRIITAGGIKKTKFKWGSVPRRSH